MIQSVESVQLALFLRTSFGGSALDLWAYAFNGAPDGFNKLPTGQTQAQGARDDVSVTFLVSSAPASRIDVILQAVEQQPPTALPRDINNVKAKIESVCNSIEKFFPKISIGRTACVVQGHTLAKNGAEANSILREMQPFLRDISEDAESISLQFAVPAVSKIQADRQLKVMRRYQTVTSMVMNIAFAGFQPPPPAATQAHAAHLLVDVYAEHMGVLTSGEAAASLREVALLAISQLLGAPNDPAS